MKEEPGWEEKVFEDLRFRRLIYVLIGGACALTVLCRHGLSWPALSAGVLVPIYLGWRISVIDRMKKRRDEHAGK